MRFVYLFAAIGVIAASGIVMGMGVHQVTDLDPMTSTGVGMIIVSFILCGISSVVGD